jgi:hypothetical protein
MNTAVHIAPDDLYLFALQLLPEEEMRSAFVHLQECELCRAELGSIQGDMVAYAMTSEMQSPPAQARERLLNQVAREKKSVAIDQKEKALEPMLSARNNRIFQMDAPEERKRRFGFMGWTGWVIAAGLGAFAFLQFQQGQQLHQQLTDESAKLSTTVTESARATQFMQTLTDPGAMRVSMHIPADPNAPLKIDPEAHAVYVPAKGSLVFIADHLDPLQTNKTYELWLLPADKAAKPVPAGLFTPDQLGNANVILPELPKGVAAAAFGVTIEDTGGSTAPTMPIVLMGM